MKSLKYIVLTIGLLWSLGAEAQSDLKVQIQSPSFRSVPSNAVRLPLLYIRAESPTPTTIQSITLRRHGLSNNEDFGHIWATAGYKRTLRAALLSDDTVTVRFRSGLSLRANEPTDITILGNLKDLPNGNAFSFSVENIEHVSTPSVEQNTTPSHSSFQSQKRREQTQRKPRIRCIRGKCHRLQY